MFEVSVPLYKTSFSYFYLGVACLNMNEIESAKYMFAYANYLDPMKAETLGYLTLVLLRFKDTHSAF